MVEIDAEGKILRCVADWGRKRVYKGLPVRTCGPSAFFRRELFEKVGGFDTSLRYCMDTDLWCRFRFAGHWYRKIPEYIWGFRIHEGSQTANPANSPEEHARQRAEILRLNARHGLRDSRAAFLPLRLSHIFDGSYLKGWLDTRRMKGLPASRKSLVIWIHSTCRSTAALVRETKRQAEAAGWQVTVCEWGLKQLPSDRLEIIDGLIPVGDNFEKGRSILREHGGPGSVQVFCVYQNSFVWRRLIVEAKKGGARVVVYSEAPCEMCLGLKTALKRLYYRVVLPWRLRAAVRAADLFISASGKMGIDRLVRLGWPREKIVPFGYSSPRLQGNETARSSTPDSSALRVLHLGSEAPYRGVKIAERAAELAGVELVKTGGKMSEEELVSEIRRADVVVGCGYCEPWGMRINDALLEGTPVIVSDGMGAAAVCDWYGCGCVVPKGNAVALAKVLKRCQEEPQFLSRLRSGAQAAAQELLPENRAKVFLNAVVSEKPSEVYEANGMIVVDQLLRKHGVIREDEVWVHGMWTPDKWRKCIVAWINGKKIVRMTHGSLSPIYLEKQGKWKKKLVEPIERLCFRLADRVVVTCASEQEWCQEWGLENEFEIFDLKKFFNLNGRGRISTDRKVAREARRYACCPQRPATDEKRTIAFDGRCGGLGASRPTEPPRSVHLLYLGRRHPLKGVEFLERAVREIGLGQRSRSAVEREFVIVAGTDAPFRKTKDALAWARATGLIGRMGADETGGKGVVTISAESIRETLNPRQREKSTSDKVHCSALTKLRELIRESKILEVHPDWLKDSSGHRTPLAGENPGISICIAYAAFRFEESLYRVRLTLKRYAQTGMSKAYAYRVNEIEVVPGTLGGKIAPATYPTDATSICGSILLQGVADVNGLGGGSKLEIEHSEHSINRTLDLRIVSDHFGEELEKDWAWCDVLVLPTLSENFGLVVAEALERGKRVITTDGAPAWEPPEEKSGSEGRDLQWRDRIIYLKGYRDGTDEERVRLLKEALEDLRSRSEV